MGLASSEDTSSARATDASSSAALSNFQSPLLDQRSTVRELMPSKDAIAACWECHVGESHWELILGSDRPFRSLVISHRKRWGCHVGEKLLWS